MIKGRLFERIRRAVLRRLGIDPGPIILSRQFPQFSIGRESYGALEIRDFKDGGSLRMGAYCSTAQGSIVLLGGGHRVDLVTTYPFPMTEKSLRNYPGKSFSRGDVVIGSDVWLATDAMILSGVTIGHGAVIMARAVVTRDVAPYAIVAGTPAREVGKRFDDATIERLLRVAWWDWPHDRVIGAAPLLLSEDITAFLDAAEAGRI